MKLRHVEIFHAVMRCGTVRGAAAMLHLTQPAASRLLQQAERALGFALFSRVRGRLVPTAEGLRLHAEIDPLYVQLEQVRRLAEALARAPTLALRVACVPSLAQDRLPRAIARLRRRHPDAHVTLRPLHSRQVLEALLLREADLGIVFDAAPHPALQAETLAEGRLVCVGRDLHDAPLPRAALDALPLIEPDPDEPLGRLLRAARDGATGASGLRVHGHHAALAMAAQGLGVAVVDSFTAATARRAGTGLHCAPLDPVLPVRVDAVRAAQSGAGNLLADHLCGALRTVLRDR